MDMDAEDAMSYRQEILEDRKKRQPRVRKEDPLIFIRDREADPEDKETGAENEEEDGGLAAIRQKRLAELKRKRAQMEENRKRGHGEYREITEEEFLKEVTGSYYVLCHFYHPEFETCKVLDKHLTILSTSHLEAKFVKLNAEKCTFFVGKLQIRVLPTIVIFCDGVAVDRVVGFEDFGNSLEFSTENLEDRLSESGAIEVAEKPVRKPVEGSRKIYGGTSYDSDIEEY